MVIRNDPLSVTPDANLHVLVRQTLAATAGRWAAQDIDDVIADIYEARRAGARPPERPGASI